MTDTQRFEAYGVLITGAARGIAATTARRSAREGARVLVTDVDPSAAHQTASAPRERGLAAEAFVCAVADRAFAEAAVAQASARSARCTPWAGRRTRRHRGCRRLPRLP